MKAFALTALFSLVGCAGPAYVAGLRPTPVAIDWATHDESRLETKDGLSLLYQSWRPLHGEPKAVVLVVHGLKDHSDRYLDFAHALVDQGYAVHAYDQRGHGDSTGNRVRVDSFDEYLDDLGLVLAAVHQREGSKKVFIFGFSMGGAVVALYTLERMPKEAGIILAGAAHKADASGFTQGSVKALGSLFPTLAVFSLDDEHFCRDPAVVKAQQADPLIYDQNGPARTAAEVVRAIDRIRAQSSTLEVPVLAMAGTADQIVPPSGSEELIAAAKTSDKTLKLYEGLWHDLLHDPDHVKVTADVVAWLDAHAQP